MSDPIQRQKNLAQHYGRVLKKLNRIESFDPLVNTIIESAADQIRTEKNKIVRNLKLWSGK